MLRLIVLLTAVVCCNACRLDMVKSQDTTDNCADSDGNHHEFHSEWEHEHEICICASFGIICCERLESTIPTTTAEIFYDEKFTEGDHGEPETASILESTIPTTTAEIFYDEKFIEGDHGEPETASILESTTTAEIFYDDFGAFTEGDHGEPEAPPIIDEDPHQLDSIDSPEDERSE